MTVALFAFGHGLVYTGEIHGTSRKDIRLPS
jgi:hypothetical protein